MENNNTDVIDYVSLKLTELSAVFDIVSAVQQPDLLRDMTISEFGFFVKGLLDDLHEKMNSINSCQKNISP